MDFRLGCFIKNKIKIENFHAVKTVKIINYFRIHAAKYVKKGSNLHIKQPRLSSA